MTADAMALIGYGLIVGFCGGGALGLTAGLMALKQFKSDIQAAMDRQGLTQDDADL